MARLTFPWAYLSIRSLRGHLDFFCHEHLHNSLQKWAQDSVEGEGGRGRERVFRPVAGIQLEADQILQGSMSQGNRIRLSCDLYTSVNWLITQFHSQVYKLKLFKLLTVFTIDVYLL